MTTALNKIIYAYATGTKRYELTNHLGNVLAVVSDKRDATNQAEVISATDYYPFDMTLPSHSYSMQADG